MSHSRSVNELVCFFAVGLSCQMQRLGDKYEFYEFFFPAQNKTN